MNSMMGDDNIHLYTTTRSCRRSTIRRADPASTPKARGHQHLARDGGNVYHGSWYSNYANTSWQSNNRTQNLAAKGLLSQNRNGGLYDINPWVGGPLLKDKVLVHRLVPRCVRQGDCGNTFFNDGSPGYSKSNTRNASVRLTWQATANNKLSSTMTAVKRLPSILNSGQDAETGGVQRFPRDYLASLVKWTSTRGGRWLFDTGWARTRDLLQHVSRGRRVPRGTRVVRKGPRFEPPCATRERSPAPASRRLSDERVPRIHVVRDGSHPSGGHPVGYGTYKHTDDAARGSDPAVLNGVPDTVSVRKYADMSRSTECRTGAFMVRSWCSTGTANVGLRWNIFNGASRAGSAAGRFVPDGIGETTNMPNWKNWSPRLGCVDLFG